MPKAQYRHRETYKGHKIDLTANSERELNEKVRLKKNEIDKGVISNSAEATVTQWAHTWLTVHKKNTVSAPVYKTIEGCLKNYALPIIGKKKIESVTATDIQLVLNSDPNSEWHKIKLRSILKSMFSQAVMSRVIAFNPCDGVSVPSTPSTSIRALTDEERAIFTDTARDSKCGLWFEILLYTGMRPQEAAALLWRDVDKKTMSVIVSKALKADGTIGETKTKSSVRIIPLPEPLFEKLDAKRGKSNEYVFVSQIGENGKGNKPLNHQTMKRMWRRFHRDMLIKAGAKTYRHKITDENPNSTVESIRELTPYYLRHTYATDLCRAGVHLRSAVALMGHTDSKMLTKIYSEFTQDQADLARAQLTNFYTQVGTNAGTK